MSQIAINFMTASIPTSDKLMLSYAKKLTLEPYAIKKKDVSALIKHGFSERDVFDINQITAYFNYVNRIADGLGVQLED